MNPTCWRLSSSLYAAKKYCGLCVCTFAKVSNFSVYQKNYQTFCGIIPSLILRKTAQSYLRKVLLKTTYNMWNSQKKTE